MRLAFHDRFYGIAIQAVCMHRLNLHFGIGGNLVHSLRQLCQDDLSGLFAPLYFAFVITSLMNIKASGKQLWLYTFFYCKKKQCQGGRSAKG
jgi:hypothetical protein